MPPPRTATGLPDGESFAQATLVRPSVVAVVALDGAGKPLRRGAGFFLGEGRILTARHLLVGAAGASCRFATGREQAATGILADDPVRDLAVLAVAPPDAGLRALPIHPRAPHRGDRLLLVSPARTKEEAISDLAAGEPLDLPGFGEILSLQGRWPPECAGSPVLRRGGEVVAVVLPRPGSPRLLRRAVAAS